MAETFEILYMKENHFVSRTHLLYVSQLIGRSIQIHSLLLNPVYVLEVSHLKNLFLILDSTKDEFKLTLFCKKKKKIPSCTPENTILYSEVLKIRTLTYTLF